MPGVQRDCVLAFAADQIDARHGADWNEVSLGRLKARLDEERLELLANVLVAILRPIDLTPTKNVNPTRQTWERRREKKTLTDQVELVDGRHDLGDSEAAHEHDVLARLSTAIEARLELTGRGAHNKKRAVRLRGARDHVRDEVPVSGSVEYGDIPVRCRECLHSDVHRNTPFASDSAPPRCIHERPTAEPAHLPLALLRSTVELPRPTEAAFANLVARPFVRHF